MNAIVISLAVLSAGAESQIPLEIKVLERLVGTWETKSVSKVAMEQFVCGSKAKQLVRNSSRFGMEQEAIQSH